MQLFASFVNRAPVEDYRRPGFDRRDFKRFLSEGPDFDTLEIVRAACLLNPWEH